MCGSTTAPTSRRRRQPLARARLAVALFVAAVSFPTGARAAFELVWPSARSAALAGAEVELVTVSSSSARGVAIERVEVSGGELYGLSEARGFLARATIGSGLGSATLSVGQLGGELYRERTVGVALARRVREAVAVEAEGRLLCLGARGVPERRAVALDAGIVARLLGRIVVAARWRNVGDARIGSSPVSAGASLGAVLVLEEIRLASSLSLERGRGTALAVGCEAGVSEWLRIRAGVAVDPGVFAAGVGIGRAPVGARGTPRGRRRGLLGSPVIDLAVTWHPDLGGSSYATVSFCR